MQRVDPRDTLHGTSKGSTHMGVEDGWMKGVRSRPCTPCTGEDSDVQTAQGKVSETRTRQKTASSQHQGYEAIVKIWWRNKWESVCVQHLPVNRRKPQEFRRILGRNARSECTTSAASSCFF